MKRKIYKQLQRWKEDSNGRTALLIEGARRVGKSYISEEFARNNYRSYILINFSEKDESYKKMFDDLSDIPLLLQKISNVEHVKLYERNSLIIFDEVQECPRARESIKFLVKDGRYDYLETGTPISIHDNVKGIVIPSEEESISMFPMDFEEFCWAMSDETTAPAIREHFESLTPMGDELHKTIMNQFRKYMLVGGMPQAVMAFSEKQDFEKAEHEKRLILKKYRDDITKRSNKSQKRRTRAIFDQIPSELGRCNKTLIPSHVEASGRMEQYEDPIYWLSDSFICNICQKTTAPNIGLDLNLDDQRIKCYMGDTGLLVSMSISDNEEIEHDIYSALLTDNLHYNEGMFAENVVAQAMRFNRHRLFYYTFYAEGSRNLQEIDFLIRRGRKICPIEVKSGRSNLHASLDKLMKSHSKSLGQAYVLHPRDLKKDGNVVYLPLYMAICL